MKLKVKYKQPISRGCFVCGQDNESGLKADFYTMENGWLIALFDPQGCHQSYPGRLHGGIVATILDEAIGRAINTEAGQDVWGVTVDFSLRYKKVVPMDEPVMVVCTIDKENRRLFEGRGVVVLSDGTIAAEGQGKYMKMALEQITDMNGDGEDWQSYSRLEDPVEIEVPEVFAPVKE